ncbi:MAG: hypothetical protein LIO91_07800, partial [Bacteroidales bacterium]|nr:hypothetical protein [Bacteroidales bacterium]
NDFFCLSHLSHFAGALHQLVLRLIDVDSEDRAQRLAILHKQRSEKTNKLKKVKLRWATGENDDEEAYREALSLLEGELDKIELEIAECEKNLSNHSGQIERVISMCCHLDSLWERTSLEMKQRLQNLVFPDGVFYNKQNEVYRTPRVNAGLDAIRKITVRYKENEEEVSDEASSQVNLCA